MENPQDTQLDDIQDSPASEAFDRSAAWLLAGFVLPFASPKYYRRSANRPVSHALTFFFILMSVVSALTITKMGYNFYTFYQSIETAYQEDAFPVITIEDGVAHVPGPQPLVLVDEERTLVVIDTTGKYQSIDRNKYDVGLLLTRKQLHLVNQQGQYERMDLHDLNMMFQTNPIVINQETVQDFMSRMLSVIAVFASVIAWLWNVFAWMAYLAVIAVGIWLTLTMFRGNIEFGLVFNTGLLAMLPMQLLKYALIQAQIAFPFMQTALLLFFWTIALVLVFSSEGIGFIANEAPLGLKRAWLGVPLLLLIAVNEVFAFKYGWMAVWAGLAITFLALVYAGFYANIEPQPVEG